MSTQPFISAIIEVFSPFPLVWKETRYTDYYKYIYGNSFVKLIHIKTLQYVFYTAQDSLYLEVQMSTNIVFSLRITEGQISCFTDQNGTLPVYYYMHEGVLYLSSDFVDLLKLIPKHKRPKLHINGILQYLSLSDDPFKETILEGVRTLADHEALTISNGTLTIIQKYNVEDMLVPMSFDDKDLNETADLFEQLLEHEISALLNNCHESMIGSMLSMGLDSSIVAYKLLSSGRNNIPLGMLISDDTKRMVQVAMAEEYVAHFGGALHTVDPYAYPDSLFKFPFGINPYTDIYAYSFNTLAHNLRAQGTDIVLSGIGGDEYFNFPRTTHHKKDESDFKKLVFNIPVKDIGVASEEEPKSLLIKSVRLANLYHNHLWHTQGIWVTNPLTSLRLINLSLQMPRQFKYEKSMLRYFCQTRNLPSGLLLKENKFTFARLFNYLFDKSMPLMQNILKDTQLGQNGIINSVALSQLLNSALPINNKQICYAIIKLELFLKHYNLYGTN